MQFLQNLILALTNDFCAPCRSAQEQKVNSSQNWLHVKYAVSDYENPISFSLDIGSFFNIKKDYSWIIFNLPLYYFLQYARIIQKLGFPAKFKVHTIFSYIPKGNNKIKNFYTLFFLFVFYVLFLILLFLAC